MNAAKRASPTLLLVVVCFLCALYFPGVLALFDDGFQAPTPLAAAVNSFGERLLKEEVRRENAKGNVLYSPLSICAAFSLVHFAADGTTKEEVDDVFGFSDPAIPEGLVAKSVEFGPTTNSLASIANRFYHADDLPVESGFIKVVGKANVKAVDFRGNPSGARADVNKFVADATDDLIPELLPAGMITGETRMVLVNAIYFKGQWEHAFPKENTAEDVFIGVNGEERVDFMKLETGGNALASSDSVAELISARFTNGRMVELPYKGGQFSMLIFLPDEVDGWMEVEENLQEVVENSRRFLKRTPFRLIKMPKWDVEFEMKNLQDYLINMGIEEAFGNADFSKMTSAGGQGITDVIHKAVMKVDEEGTIAAAATSGVATKSLPPPPEEFIVNRPFVYRIVNKEDGSVFFQGTITAFS